uniref:M20/M25/M40 family metallo-hydrolase n=2 Tax=Thermorudis TaxID=1649508 RepID=A0A831TAL1_9BACT
MRLSEEIRNRLVAAVAEHADAMIGFAQRAVQTRSLPGEEEAMARLLRSEMERLGYDEVWVDRVGNVIGLLRGSGGGKSVQFNSHIDHVHEGDPALWPYPPYAGVIEGGVLYGRAASDVKGALAAQVYLGPVLRTAGLRPRGDIFITGVVLEELGGFGTATLCQELRTDYAVLGEATNLEVRRGHRGRILVEVRFTGRSVHASAPERGANPHYALARFLRALEELPMRSHPDLGRSTVAPTLIATDQTSSNVTPGVLTLSLDWRNVSCEEPEDVVARVRELAQASLTPGVTSEAQAVGRRVRSYTGLEAEMPPTRGFVLPGEHPLVRAAATTLGEVFQRQVPVGLWQFATDGGHLARAGIATIGFAPAEERFAHTVNDQVSLHQLRQALLGNAALALALPDAEEGSPR